MGDSLQYKKETVFPIYVHWVSLYGSTKAVFLPGINLKKSKTATIVQLEVPYLTILVRDYTATLLNSVTNETIKLPTDKIEEITLEPGNVYLLTITMTTSALGDEDMGYPHGTTIETWEITFES